MGEWTEWDTSVSQSHSHKGAGLQSSQRGRYAQPVTHFIIPQAPAQAPVTPVTRLNPLGFTLTSLSTLPLLSLPPVSNTAQETWMCQGCPKFLAPLLLSWPGALARSWFTLLISQTSKHSTLPSYPVEQGSPSPRMPLSSPQFSGLHGRQAPLLLFHR